MSKNKSVDKELRDPQQKLSISPISDSFLSILKLTKISHGWNQTAWLEPGQVLPHFGGAEEPKERDAETTWYQALQLCGRDIK